MKKLLALTLTVALAFSLSACAFGNTTAASIIGGSYFLSDSDVMTVGSIDETSVYDITYTAAKETPVEFTLSSGSYVTRVYDTERDGVHCYRFDTTLKIEGSYTLDGTVTPVSDEITTTADFLGVGSSFKPIYSHRTVNAHTVGYQDKAFTLDAYVYSVTTTYDHDANKAVVAFEPDEELSSGKFTLAKGETTYDKVFEKTYFDNETLLFAIRAFKLTTTFSSSFTSIDATAKTKRTLTLSSLATVDEAGKNTSVTEETLPVTYINSGEKITGADTYRLALAVGGTYTGSSTILNYAKGGAKEGQRLIRMQVPLQLDITALVSLGKSAAGTFVYTLKSVTKNR